MVRARLGRAAQLRERDHGDVQFLGESLQSARDRRQLQGPVVEPPAATHELQVVHDDIGHARAAAAGFHLAAAAFHGLVIEVVLRRVYRERVVSADAIAAALCGYLLLGVLFGHAYGLTEAAPVVCANAPVVGLVPTVRCAHGGAGSLDVGMVPSGRGSLAAAAIVRWREVAGPCWSRQHCRC